jgi:hypothetical protein
MGHEFATVTQPVMPFGFVQSADTRGHIPDISMADYKVDEFNWN